MNELLFLLFTVFLLALGLGAFRLGKWYVLLLIVVYSLLMNIFVLKQFTLFGLAVTGGNALYGAIFLLTDMLSEHYGKREALRSVALGFGVMVLFVIATQVLLWYVPSEVDFAQGSLATLFSLSPRILFGSLCAYAVAQSFDVWWYHRLRQWTGERWLWVRNLGSTGVSQFVDSLLFTAIGLTAFSWLPVGGVIPPDLFWELVFTTYAIKLIVALLDTPFLYLSSYCKPRG